MNGDPRDPLDDAIARDLGSLAPEDLDVDAVLGGMRPALHRARARRRLAVSSGVVGALVVVLGLGGLFAAQRPGRVRVEGHPTTLPGVSTTSTSPKSSTTTTRPPGKATSTTTATTPGTTPGTGATPVTPTSQGHSGTTQPGTGSTKPPPAAPSTTTYRSIGGSITVAFANGALTLDSSKASAGYQTDVHNQDPDDVEVRFNNGTREYRIRVRVQNGVVQKEITEN